MSVRPCRRVVSLLVSMRVCRRRADATDSPSRRALERKRNVPVPAYDDILEVDVVSSPPATRQVHSDQGFEGAASSQQSQPSPQKPTSTPFTLGGSLFRRKAAAPIKDSSPLDASTILSSKMQSIDSQESATTSRHESQDLLLSHRPTYPAENPYASFSSKKSFTARTSYGKTLTIEKKPPWKAVIRDQQKRSEARAHKEAYYGVDIHGLLNLTEDQPPTPFQSRSYFPCPRFPYFQVVWLT
jgi:hypothetical protein